MTLGDSSGVQTLQLFLSKRKSSYVSNIKKIFDNKTFLTNK